MRVVRNRQLRAVSRTARYAAAAAAALGLIAGVLPGQAQAASTPGYTCVVNGLILSSPVPCDYGTGPVSLINEQQLAQGLYAATAAQQQSLSDLEQQAVNQTLTDHDLPSSQADAVQSWGRDDAEGELWAILETAIQTPAASRSTDQQNAVDWLTAVDQRQAVHTADAAGLEYTKWAGLGQAAYQSLVTSNPTQDALQSFLSQDPLPYNNGAGATDPNASTGGYCVYQSPAPDQGDYTDNVYANSGQNAPSTCFGPCLNPLGCTPPTPTLQNFEAWGTDDATSAQFDNAAFALSARDIELTAGFGTAAAGAGTGFGLSFLSSAAVIDAGLADAFYPLMIQPFAQFAGGPVVLGADAVAELAGAITAATVGVIVTAVVAAIAIAVVEGISVIQGAEVPGQLAALIANANSSTPDLASMLSSTSGAEGLFGLFVGATLPSPLVTSCDNSQLVAGATIPQPCLNPTDILPVSSSDPEFSILAKGASASTATTSPQISWNDAQSDTDNTARAAGNWFVDQVTDSTGVSATVQSLRIDYTDWSGTEQTAWLVDDGSGQPVFLSVAEPASGAPPLSAATCEADNECGASRSIEYVGTDGTDYTATLTPRPAPSATTPTPAVTEGYSYNPSTGVSKVSGDLTPASATDTGSLTVSWGDGSTSTEDYGPGSTGGALNFTAGSGGQTDYSATHDYAAGSTPNDLTVTATSQDGQSATAETIVPGSASVVTQMPILALPSVPAHTYGDTPFQYTASITPDNAVLELSVSGVNSATGQSVCRLGSQASSFPNPDDPFPPRDVTATVTMLSPGTCTISAYSPAGNAIAADSASVSFTVNPAPLTITAQDATATTGSPLPAFDATFTGLQNDDTGNVVSGLSCTATDSAGQPLTTTPAPGSYPITCSGASAPGYAISYASGTLTVSGTQAITFAAPPDHAYGDAPFTISATGGGSGQPVTFTSADPATCALSDASGGTDSAGGGTGTATVTITGAGTCKLTASQAAGSGYAAAAPLSRTFTVAKAPLTITANNAATTYGHAPPAFGATFTGLVNGDTSAAVTGLTCGATTSSGNQVSATTPVGSYPITCSGASTANYAISYQPGTLTVSLFAAGSASVSGGGSGACQLSLSGSGALTAAGTLSVDGTSSRAMCLSGGATVTAPLITVQGGVSNSYATINGTVRTQQPATADLLATLPAPAAPSAACPGSACPGGASVSGRQVLDIQPGSYTKAILVTGSGTLCVAPGVYVLNADWTVSGAGAVLPYGAAGCPALPSGNTDPGVLLYFASGHLALSGGVQFTALHAMTGGPYAGLLYWQAGTTKTTLGGATAFAGGGWYEPAGALVLDGSGAVTAPYVAAGTITISGGATLHVISQ